MAILNKLSKKHQTQVKYISPGAMNLLKSYSWDGNVRELEHILERIVLISDIPILSEKEIKDHLELESNVEKDVKDVINKEVVDRTSVKEIEPEKNGNDVINVSAIKTLKELELEAIKLSLERNNWNMTTTSKALGISRMTLYRKLDQHNLQKNGK